MEGPCSRCAILGRVMRRCSTASENLGRPRYAIAIALFGGGCCLAPMGEPVPVPTVVAAPTSASVEPACLGLCERIAGCDRDEGRVPGAPDCPLSCAAGGVYASLDRDGLACAGQPSCQAVRQCAAPELAMALLGSMATATPTSTPPDWPEGFPAVPGGAPRAAPTMGPVRVALIAYPSRDVNTTDRAYRDALAAAGWTVEDAPADAEAHRFVAAHESESVSVSIYRDGSDTIVQTMQLEALMGHGGS